MNLSEQLTAVYITARDNPEFNWMRAALGNLRIVGIYKGDADKPVIVYPDTEITIGRPVKPNIFQGPFRITKQDWWFAAGARNTGICHVKTPWVLFLDDRSVLTPGWEAAIEAAISGNYIVAGAYEKRANMRVDYNGIVDEGSLLAEDGRLKWCQSNNVQTPFQCGGEWLYGAAFAMPVEWYLNANGQDETTGGLGFEDTPFGIVLQNNGYPFRYDPRLKLVEDRTGGECGPTMFKSDFGVSPNDWSHAFLERCRKNKRSEHLFTPELDLRKQREEILAGWPFPIPEKREYRHPFTNQLISEI
jgi:hypothetical protein